MPPFSRQQWLNAAFKTAVALLLCALLYYELWHEERLPIAWQQFRLQLPVADLRYLIGAVLLMPLNWLAETEKWRQILKQYEPISRWKALRAVLGGVAVSLFTPNRVGEYAGRIPFISPANRWKAVIINLVGNYAQLAILFGCGALGALWLMWRVWQLDILYIRLFGSIALVGLSVVLLLFFNLKALVAPAKKLLRWKPIKRFAKDVNIISQFRRRELGAILGWAALRYAVYATQYYFLLQFFNIKTSLMDGFSGIASIFLLQTSLPLPPVTGLVARGNLAVQIWGKMGANDINSLAATFSLWIINLILPALVGTFSLFYVNIAKTFVHENEAA